jgi:Mrp family chromosome partitioning ATPase/capsular polysaccharide biosynthesis protein
MVDHALLAEATNPWTAPAHENQMVGLADILPALKRAFWMITGCVVAAVLLAIMYLIVIPPGYVAVAELLIEPAKLQLLSQSGNFGDATLDTAEIESQVEVLGSERIADDVVKTLRLTDDPDFRSNAATSNYQRRRIALARFRAALSVRRIGQSDVIEISFRSADPAKAARIANAITAAYIRDQLQARSEAAQQASRWIQDRVTELGVQLNAAAKAVQQFRTANGILDYNANNQPRLIDKLTELEARAEAYRKLYAGFLAKATEDEERASYPVANARVITAASTPLVKSYPKTGLVLALAILLGLVAGGAASAGRSMLDGRVRNDRQIRRLLGLDCLASLPRVRSRRKRGSPPLYEEVLEELRGDRSSPFGEAIRSIKVSLQNSHHGRLGDGPLRLGIVSLLPGEGTSTLAVSLAASFAASAAKTLLIDANFWQPSLSAGFAPRARRGLIDALRDVPDGTIVSAPRWGFHILPAGHPPHSHYAEDIFGSEAMKRLLSRLEPLFDVMIVDLPPSTCGLHARALGPLLDGCILVAEWGRASLQKLGDAVDILRTGQVHLAGAIVNKSQEGVPPLFGYRLADLCALGKTGSESRRIEAVSR